MLHSRAYPCVALLLFCSMSVSIATAQEQRTNGSPNPIYDYESKPGDDEFAVFSPAKAPQQNSLILKKGDRLAIVGDSITEQKMYSRIIENILPHAFPSLKFPYVSTVGEVKQQWFLRRMRKTA